MHDRHPSYRRANRDRLPIWRLLFAVVFASLLWGVDWQALRSTPFADIENYVANFETQAYFVAQDAVSLIRLYTQEFLWRKGVYALAEYYDLQTTFAAFSLVFLTAISVYVASKTRSLLYLPLLVSPLVIDLAFSQIRSAIAASLFYLALLIHRSAPRWALIVSLPFVHSAAAIHSGAFIAGAMTRYRVVNRHRVLFLAGVIVTMAIAVGPMRTYILSSIDDRRAGMETEQSGILLTLMLVSYGVPFLLKKRFAYSFNAFLVLLSSALCLSVYLSGGSGNRFVALTMPALAVAIFEIENKHLRMYAYAWVVSSSAIYFIFYWLK